MSTDAWIADTKKRLTINEGYKTVPYADSMGILTVGVGHNLSSGVGPLRAIGLSALQASAIINNHATVTPAQIDALLNNDLAFAINDARASLASLIFDALTDARRFVVTDLCFNMGLATWTTFVGTRGVIEAAQREKNHGQTSAHDLFVSAGKHLQASAYYTQTGNRARRNVAMLIQGTYCDGTGDGSDIYQGA